MSEATIHRVGIIMNGVTGRMGTNQHLLRSIHAIMQQGGVAVGPAERILPEPLLVGRNALKLETLSKRAGNIPYSTDLDAALSDPKYAIYFDAQTTDRRAEGVRKAIAARKHVYCEKPIADSSGPRTSPPCPAPSGRPAPPRPRSGRGGSCGRRSARRGV